MRLSKASAYAVFAAVHVARHQHAGPVQGRSIAEAYGIPSEYLLKILQQLVRFQILRSETGRRGGFVLKHPASEISLLQILEAVDGPLNGELTAAREILGADEVKRQVESLFGEVTTRTRDLLRGTTVEHLLST